MTVLDISASAARAALRGLIDDHQMIDDGVAVERFARVIWGGLTEPGDGVAGRLVAALGAAGALDAVLARPAGADADLARNAAGISADELRAGRARWSPRLNESLLVGSWEQARRHRIRLVQPGDPHWPVQLDDLGHHAPLSLWVRGDPAALARLRQSVALVGARAATSYGEEVAAGFAADLAGSGVAVVSGGAYGIDGAAHRASMMSGGLTIAVLAGGVERSYPAGHTLLFERIAATAAVVSEVPCGSAPTKWRFLHGKSAM